MDSAPPPNTPKAPSTPPQNDAEVLLVGRIGAPHGIRGWVHLSSYTDPPENLAELKPLLLRPAGPASAGAGPELIDAGRDRWQPIAKIKIKRTGSSSKPRLLALLPGVDTRTAAEALRGAELGLRSADLPAADPDSYYWRDLQGLRAIDPTGLPLGVVSAVLDTPAHDVLVIAVTAALVTRLGLEAPGEVLVPFVNEFTGAIDLAAGTIVIDWPAVFDPEAR